MNMNAEQAALMERWNAFLQKIDARLRELIVEAEAGLAGLIQQYPEDFAPIGNALSGLDHRVAELRKKIDETWESSVEPKFKDMRGENDFFWDAGLDRRGDAQLAFDQTWATCKVRATTAFYRNLWPRAQAALQKPVPCSRCGGELTLPTRVSSVSVPCAFCKAVTQVIPDKLVTMCFGAFGGAGHVFGEEAALPLRFAIDRFRVEVDRARRAAKWAAEPVESLDRWEAMERAYWMKYAECAAGVTGRATDMELVESRMASFRKYSLETDQRWRRAKGL